LKAPERGAAATKFWLPGADIACWIPPVAGGTAGDAAIARDLGFEIEARRNVLALGMTDEAAAAIAAILTGGSLAGIAAGRGAKAGCGPSLAGCNSSDTDALADAAGKGAGCPMINAASNTPCNSAATMQPAAICQSSFR
jgi:hypothetical protein